MRANIDDAEILRECAKLSTKTKQAFLDAMPLTRMNCERLVSSGMDVDWLVDHISAGAVMYSPRADDFIMRGT